MYTCCLRAPRRLPVAAILPYSVWYLLQWYYLAAAAGCSAGCGWLLHVHLRPHTTHGRSEANPPGGWQANVGKRLRPGVQSLSSTKKRGCSYSCDYPRLPTRKGCRRVFSSCPQAMGQAARATRLQEYVHPNSFRVAIVIKARQVSTGTGGAAAAVRS